MCPLVYTHDLMLICHYFIDDVAQSWRVIAFTAGVALGWFLKGSGSIALVSGSVQRTAVWGDVDRVVTPPQPNLRAAGLSEFEEVHSRSSEVGHLSET